VGEADRAGPPRRDPVRLRRVVRAHQQHPEQHQLRRLDVEAGRVHGVLADRLPQLEQLGIDPRRQVGARLDPWRHETNQFGVEVTALLQLLGADLDLGQHASTPLSAHRRVSRWVRAGSRRITNHLPR